MFDLNKKNYAFTLVEVLLTLVIVGVVAAMLIPTLITYINRTAFKSAYKKAYANTISAFDRVASDNGGNIKGVCQNSVEFRDLLSSYMLKVKTCDQGYSQGCRYSSATGQNGQVDSGLSWAENSPAVVLNDGTIMQFYLSAPDCSDGVHGCGFVTIDVNGMGQPNRAGEDVYMLHIKSDSIKPFGSPGDGYVNDCDTYNSMGWTCAFDRLND